MCFKWVFLENKQFIPNYDILYFQNNEKFYQMLEKILRKCPAIGYYGLYIMSTDI